MKKNGLELFEEFGFKNAGLLFIKELTPSPDKSFKIVITKWDEEWCTSVEGYYGKEKKYAGSTSFNFKSLKRCFNKLEKEYAHLGFKKIA